MEKEVCLRVVLSAQRFSRRCDGALSPHGISFLEYLVLRNIGKSPNGYLKNIDVAQAVGLSASGATRMLKPMEKIGVVRREKDERDGRATRVMLTDAGKGILEDAETTVGDTAQQFLKGMEVESKKQLEALLTDM